MKMFNKYFKAKEKERYKKERKEFFKKEISFLDKLKSNEDNYYNLFAINNIVYNYYTTPIQWITSDQIQMQYNNQIFITNGTNIRIGDTDND